jgi:hypothetical protein
MRLSGSKSSAGGLSEMLAAARPARRHGLILFARARTVAAIRIAERIGVAAGTNGLRGATHALNYRL